MILRLYLDTAPLIYLVEQVPRYFEIVNQRLSPSDMVVISELSRLECRVKPLRGGDVSLLGDFDRFFAESVAEVVPLSRDVMERATEIRAHYGFKTPDSIHLASAVQSACQVFLTNDHRLDRCAELSVEVISV